MAKKKEVVEVEKKVVGGMDKFDLEAEREGASISSANKARVKKSSKKPKVGPVNSKTLDESFSERYGNSGYTAKKEKD